MPSLMNLKRWSENTQLKSAEQKLSDLQRQRSKAEAALKEAEAQVSAAKLDVNRVETKALLNLATERDAQKARQGVDEAQQQQQLAHRALLDLERQISLLTPALPSVQHNAKQVSMEQLRAEYRAAVKDQIVAFEAASKANERTRIIYESATSQFPGWLAGDVNFPQAGGLPMLGLEEMRPSYAPHGARIETLYSRWLRKAKQFLSEG